MFPENNAITNIYIRVAVANLVLTTFLALKNTPLAFLTAYSYERINYLHQLAGYHTVFWSILHAVVYITAWAKSDTLHELEEKVQVMGIVAGFALLIILASSFLVRKRNYDLFYAVHIVMFILIIITVGLHRPEVPKNVWVYPIVAGGMWFIDRVLRAARFLWYSVHNQATITPLPCGGTRIVLRKSPARAVPGSHCFLWVPSIRRVQAHPFTIISTNPLELVAAAYDGFTRDLYARAVESPGRVLHASIDGPYGALPAFNSFDKVVVVAGGSGGSFACAVALSCVRAAAESRQSPSSVEFIWVVREQSKSHTSNSIPCLILSVANY